MSSRIENKRFKSRKRALVCGGAGFLGTHLCARLLEDGYEVVALDNLVTGDIENLRNLQAHPTFSFVQHDITQAVDVDADEIYNLACCASPIHYQADPEHTMRTCLEGSLNLLSLARRTGARIFQASTSEVYGEPEVHPQKETYRGAVNPVGPRACYDEGKRCAEAIFFDYHRLYGVEIKVARIFNTYGPFMNENDGRVVSNFIAQALRGEPITLNGDGSQTRSFCYVDDLIEGIVRLMRSDRSFTGPVNLGNPAEITVLELAKLVISITGSSSRVVRRPMPVDDPTRRCPDIGLAHSRLDWQPVVPLHEGLRRTAAWFEQRFSNEEKTSFAPPRELAAAAGAAA